MDTILTMTIDTSPFEELYRQMTVLSRARAGRKRIISKVKELVGSVNDKATVFDESDAQRELFKQIEQELINMTLDESEALDDGS